MLKKNSSSEMAYSAPDHFGTKDTKDRSLGAEGRFVLNLSLKR